MDKEKEKEVCYFEYSYGDRRYRVYRYFVATWTESLIRVFDNEVLLHNFRNEFDEMIWDLDELREEKPDLYARIMLTGIMIRSCSGLSDSPWINEHVVEEIQDALQYYDRD